MDDTEVKLNILVAYPYMSPQIVELLKAHSHMTRFLLDSGAFTAWKAGKTIELDQYSGFIRSLPIKPWRYFALDVVGDAHKSMTNYQSMLQSGLSPIPVFTRGEVLSALDEYYKTSDVVGIGGLVQTKGNKAFVKGIMKHIGSRRVHLLGFGNHDFIGYFRPYSYDSSSWSSGVRFGNISLYDRNGRWLKKFGKPDMPYLTEDHKKQLRIYGYTLEQLRDPKEWVNDGRNQSAVQCIPYRAWTKYLIDVQLKLKSKFFIAVSNEYQLRGMLEAFTYWRNHGG